MAATVLALTIYKGLTFPALVITAKDSLGVVQNLTGWSVYAELRENPSQALLLNLAPTITNAVAGEITVPAIAYAVTGTLAEGNDVWDLVLQNPAGQRLGPMIGGSVAVVKPVTQPA